MTTDAYLDQPAPSVLADLDQALETTPRLPRDLVTVTLARRYARALDLCLDQLESDDAIEDAAHHARKVLEIARLGQRMEGMLDRLGMAPGARPAVPGNPNGAERDPQSSALDQLRTDAAAGAPTSGVDYAASVDPSVTDADTAD
jgi:hypothetical protein